MSYQIAAIPMTLNDVQGNSSTARLFIWYLYSRAATDKIQQS